MSVTFLICSQITNGVGWRANPMDGRKRFLLESWMNVVSELKSFDPAVAKSYIQLMQGQSYVIGTGD